MINENVISHAIQLIKEGQGCRNNVYSDTLGFLTIGYGHKLLNQQQPELTIVSQQQAEEILKMDLDKAIKQVIQYWGASLQLLNEERTAAIIDMTFNMGSVRWPKLTLAIKNCNWQQAAQQIMNSKYSKQVGTRAKRNAQIIRGGKMLFKNQVQ